MLNKEKVKKFWNENKDLIIGCTMVVAGGVIWGVAISNNRRSGMESAFDKLMKEDEGFRRYYELLVDVDKAKIGGTMYVPIDAADFRNLNPTGIVSTDHGYGPNLKVTGGILFGNVVK